MINLPVSEKPVKFRTDRDHDRRTPIFVNNVLGGKDEIARWVLDLNDILYEDRPHTAPLHLPVIEQLTGQKGPENSPVLIRTDVMLYSPESIVTFYEQRCLPERRLLPADPAARQKAWDLFHHFTGALDKHVSTYVYSLVLMHRAYAMNWCSQGIPMGERMQHRWMYNMVRKKLVKDWDLNNNTAGESLIAIKRIFETVNELLSDGRRYLTGDRISVADIALSSVAAPLLLPNEFGGAAGAIHKVPDEVRIEIEELRATPAGQFILLMYHHDRPLPRSQYEIPKEPGAIGKLRKLILLSMDRRKTGLFCFVQNNFPVLRLGIAGLVTVNRNDLLVEMMERDNDFTVEEINGKKMANQKGAFFLGMDRNNPQFDKERNFVRRTAKREDLDVIRAYVRSSCEEILSQAKSYGRIDVADSMCYPVLVGFIDKYFGVPPPTIPVMRHWLRVLFYDLFLNFTNNRAKHEAAVEASLERKKWIMQLIKDRKRQLDDGQTIDDNVLNRMILMQREPGNGWFDDETIQRNVGGLITGILETTNKAAILVLDELFNRPEDLKGAIETAQAKDMTKMYAYVCEAMRFNPAQPGVIRYCKKPQVLTGKGNKKYLIKAHRKVFALTACAMMDPAVFPEPRKFNADRKAVYMNYGYALHECYGKYINAVTISEFVAAILRMPGIRRGDGWAGKGTGLHDGPFFNNFVVAFTSNKEI